jgi:hypothetical protein
VISDAVNRPAPRIVSAIEDLARQLHPEAFADKPAGGKQILEKEHPATPPGFISRGFPIADSFQLGTISRGVCLCVR